MANREWIESAAHERTVSTSRGIESSHQHTLVLARADEKREAEERTLAVRTVRRFGGLEAPELLAMLGLEAS